MSYRSAILNHAPNYWDRSAAEETQLLPSSEEYNQIAYEARHAVESAAKSILKIVRIQNVHDLGQVLIREQLLLAANTGTDYYRVRRFIKLHKQYYLTALKYNLDHRRCGLAELSFHKNINHLLFRPTDVLVAVQVVTSNFNDSKVVPSNNLEYFIDYVIFFN